ncbi:P27 family phage terminase small subunit [Sulfuriferula sp.]|uniref:P27 family phage terminase small subunit n=1 Tax=Sulfuriferula sp. TaxID=2025307 RepID=UPI0027318CE9|nr:P27 family phage terminase small subunit [Sulfuriferula sp.]MDP1620347.1 P27 family phage terminase small subunit [bacterium]MDP2026436.1 P27 family phage terminase small subunit [Sulfuriferula sp.]
MSDLRALPTVSPDVGASGTSAVHPLSIDSEIPVAPAKLSAKERRIWDQVTLALHEVGLIHRTDGMLLTVICRTFASWISAEEEIAEYAKAHDGSYIVSTPNGYQQPHQLYYVARNLKRELLQWLPEAALTIPSFNKMLGDAAKPQQGALFDDPVAAHRDRKTAMGMTLIQGSADQV